MHRLYREQVQKLFALVAWANLRGHSWDRIFEDLQTNMPWRSDTNNRSQQLLRDFLRFGNNRGDGDVLSKLGHDLTESLVQGDAGKHDGELVDQIVNALQSSYAGNLLSGRTLERLRAALLLPEEAAKFRNELQQREMSCVGCGHTFQEGEVSTFVGTNGFFCVTCSKPQMAPCPKCKRSSELDKRVRRAIEKGTVCQQCAGGAEVVIEEPQQAASNLAPEATPAHEVRRYVRGVDEPQPGGERDRRSWETIRQAARQREEMAAHERVGRTPQIEPRVPLTLRNAARAAATTYSFTDVNEGTVIVGGTVQDDAPDMYRRVNWIPSEPEAAPPRGEIISATQLDEVQSTRTVRVWDGYFRGINRIPPAAFADAQREILQQDYWRNQDGSVIAVETPTPNTPEGEGVPNETR